jgi:alpha-2-macroglobulin
MLAALRAGLLAVPMFLAAVSATFATDKPFQRDDLADGAIRLEAQVKSDAGSVTKPIAALRRDVDAAVARSDFQTGLQIQEQMAASAPNDSAIWLRLARILLQTPASDDREHTALLERASAAAYIAYQRATTHDAEAEALVVVSRTFARRKLWRPALDSLRFSLELREVASVRADYDKMREDYGFRLLDYSVDADTAAPRACFQLSEALPARRTDFSPFVAVAGQDKPAISVDDKQLCVEGLKHGEHYSITLRAGLPSVVKENLTNSADMTIYVRDRSPFARFVGKAYVLPRTGQRGIPVVSVNTPNVKITIYRIGDRNLLNTIISQDFQRNLRPDELERIASERGTSIWSGELKVEQPQLNAETTTVFPVDQAVGDLAPGVYVMSAAAGAASDQTDSYDQLATQWFIVSDLGLTAFSANDGVHVFVHSLASAATRGDVDVRLLARNNEVLATRKTDANGYALFEPGLARGEGGAAPALLIAADPRGDYAFLNLSGPAFDLSDRGVAGRPATEGLDAFVVTERGVYRTGETVHITTLLRDGQDVAAAGVPLTLVVERPDGVEYRRTVVADQGLGGRSFDVPIAPTATTGTWHVRAYTDPKRSSVGETTFLVEDYMPDRIEFDLATSAKSISKAQPATVTVDGRFLYGAPGAGLELSGELKVKPVAGRPGFAGYQFGTADEGEEAAATETPLEDLPATDAKGKASLTIALDKLPETTRPMEAEVVVRLAESGGRGVERKLTLPVAPTTNMIGAKPLFSGRALRDGEIATFDVVVVAPDGKALARNGVHYELLKVDNSYQWYRQDGAWQYEPVKRTSRIADGTIDVAVDKPGRIALPVSWGRYRLDLTGPDLNGPSTSLTFDAGFYAEAGSDTPDLLDIALDKPEYRPGDAMAVSFNAASAGNVTINVIGDKLLATSRVDVREGPNRIALNVGRDWGSGAYVVATLRRPLDAAAGRMPSRAIGVHWFAIDRAAQTIAVDLKTPQLVRPNTTLRVPVMLANLAGEEARIVVAAVDVGILNLTNYRPPAPDDYYLGQRQLSADIRDLYGQLIDGMQGTRGQIRSGGDQGGELQGSPPTQPPLALYSGVVSVGTDGNAEVTFDIPDFAGTVRVMAIAWSKTKVGHAAADVVVRDPVVVTATLPRFLLAGDRGNMQIEIDNVEGPAGDYRVGVSTDGPVAASGGAQTLRLNAKQRQSFAVPITSAGAGTSAIKVSVAGPAGFAIERNYALTTKPATQVLARRTVKPIARGESLTLSNDLFADLVAGTGSISVSVGPSTALDAATILQALDRYPFGCSEQITSRALPLLYVNELAAQARVALDTAVDQRIRDAIERLLTRQGANGSFGLWSVGGEDAWLDAYVSDFLTRARERGFAVPDVAFKLALDRLRNFAANAPEPKKNGGIDLAYALYVLARNGVAPVGDLRYLADTQLDNLSTPVAIAQVGAALAMMGDRVRADRVYGAALTALSSASDTGYGRPDYGTQLRDAAAVVTLTAENGGSQATITNAIARVEQARAVTTYASTQENAWMALAARALEKEAKISLRVDGAPLAKALYRTYRPADLTTPVRIENAGEATLQAVVSVNGAPITPEPPAEQGFKIERTYYTPSGEKVDAAKVKQNTRLVVVLKVTEPKPQYGRVLIADYLPAGFEIDNPNLVSSGDTGTLDWILDAAEPTHAEFRDDHFGAAFDRTSKSPAVFSVAYVVRAISPGQYVLPQAYVEDMYRPDRFGRTATGAVEVTK